MGVQTREEKIKLFDKNQEIALMEEAIYLHERDRTDPKRVNNVFLKLLDNIEFEVVDKPVFIRDNKKYLIKTYLIENEENMISEFSNYKKVFLYTIKERFNTQDESGPRKLIVRFATPDSIS